MPSKVYFKQFNIYAKQMYENTFALCTVDPTKQKVKTVEDINVASESAGVESANKLTKWSREPLDDISWPMEEDFVTTLQEDGWRLRALDPCNPTISNMTIFLCRPAQV